jgi:uncharacterized protein YndB with AHSA1/START domain
MKNLKALLIACAALVPFAAIAAPDIKDTSYRDAEGHRVQQLQLTVDVPPAKVWAALTTDSGIQGWVAPVAHVTPGNNGLLEASYLPSSKLGDADNIRNRIVVYLPNKLLVFHNEHVPQNGPFKQEAIDKIRTMIELQDLGDGRTRIVESGVGYGEGPDFDTMYAHFRDGNAEEFGALAEALAGHPIDWKAMAAQMQAAVQKREASKPVQ